MKFKKLLATVIVACFLVLNLPLTALAGHNNDFTLIKTPNIKVKVNKKIIAKTPNIFVLVK